MPKSLLEGLVTEEAARASAHLRPLYAEYGTYLMREDDHEPTLTWIDRGQVSVQVGGIELGVAEGGEVLGEGAVFGPWARPYTTRAVSPCDLVIVDREAWRALRADGSAVALRLELAALASIIRWVRAVDAQIADLADGRKLQFERAGWLAQVSEWLGAMPGTPVTVDAARALADSPNLRDADPSALGELAERLEAVRWPANYAILVEGSTADRVHLLVEGEVRVIRHTRSGRGETLATLAPGAVFGMSAALDREGHGATCVAHGSAVTLSMDAEAWNELVASDTPAGSAARLAAIRALGDAFVYGSAQLLRLVDQKRRDIHEAIAPLYEVGTPSEVRPPAHDDRPPLHIVY